jgi:Spy/CpxP family protein refolding chaperone
MPTSLALSNDQIQQLEEIRGRSSELRDDLLRRAAEADRAAAALLRHAAPDLASYEAVLRDAAGYRVEAGLTGARALLEARKVLTAEQREKLRAATEMMMEMMERHR